MQKTVLVWGEKSNKILNKYLEQDYKIINQSKIEDSDDLGISRRKGVIFTIEK
jgi:hypothetical protein